MPEPKDETQTQVGVDWGQSSPVAGVRVETVTFEYGADYWKIVGHPHTVRIIAQEAGRYRLIENITLAALAFLMLSVAALVAVFAPEGRDGLIRWIIIPACIYAFASGGFVAFRMKLSWTGLEVAGGHPGGEDQRASKQERASQGGIFRKLFRAGP